MRVNNTIVFITFFNFFLVAKSQSLEFGTYAKYKNYFSKNNPNCWQYWENNKISGYLQFNKKISEKAFISLGYQRIYLKANIAAPFSNPHPDSTRNIHHFVLSEIPVMFQYQIKSIHPQIRIVGIAGMSQSFVLNAPPPIDKYPNLPGYKNYKAAYSSYNRGFCLKSGIAIERLNKQNDNKFVLKYLIDYAFHNNHRINKVFFDRGFSTNLMIGFNFNF